MNSKSKIEMKIKLIFTILLVGIGSFADNKVLFGCYPSQKETRFQVLENEEEILVRFVNPRGYESMPQFDGPVSAEGISLLKWQIEGLKNIGNQIQFSWKKNNCQIEKEKQIINCDNKGNSSVSDIIPFSITTTEITEKIKLQESKKIKYRLVLESQGNIFFPTIEFSQNFCN